MFLNSLKSRIIISITGIVIVSLAITTFFFRQKVKDELSTALENNAINLLNATKHHVESQYNSILHYKTSMISLRKSELKQSIELAFKFIEHCRLEHKNGILSENDSKQKAFDFIRTLRYDNGIGYFWIINTQRPLPLTLMHPTHLQLENTYLKEKKYYCALGKGENLTKAMVDVCLEHGEGYVNYLWEKPNFEVLTEQQPKISYVKLFKSWNWIIGTGFYIDDIEKDVQNRIHTIIKDLNKTIIKQKIGKNGYFFIFNEKNLMLVHPNLAGKDISNMVNPTTKNLICNDLKKVTFSSQPFMKYLWDKPGCKGEFKFPKKIFMTYYEPLRWYIGSSFYTKNFEKKISDFNHTIILFSGAFIIIALIISIFLAKSITTPLKIVMRSIQKTNLDGIPKYIIPKTNITEINMLRTRINNMINTISASKEELEQQRDFSMNIIHDAPYIIAGIQQDGLTNFINPAGEKITGYCKEEVVGKNWWNLFYPGKNQHQGEKLCKKMKENNIEDYEISLICKNGEEKTILWSSFSKKDKNNIIQIIGMGSDITNQKLSEKEMAKAKLHAAEHEKQALVGEIAGKIAHDFNNILSIIMGNAELSLIQCGDSKIKKILKLIFKQTVRGKILTKNLIAFARDHEPKQEFFQISEKIDLVLDLLKKDLKDVKVIRNNKSGTPQLLADPGMIEHALVNIIQNSIHATSMVEHPKITIKTYNLNDDIYFEIEDNGCGIPQQHIEHIYDSSFTLKGNKDVTDSYKNDIHGSGYGMANVKKYIEQQNGSISVTSVLGSWTKFIIKMPVIKQELTSEEKTEIQKEIIHVNKYILLVEDETAISDIQHTILTQSPCNHKVDIADNGKIAKYLFDKNQYDFISLDYILPGKYNGMDVYNHIRNINKTIPILFISGNIEFLESIKYLQQNDDYLDHQSKPCPNTDYVSSINQLLEKSSKGCPQKQ